MIKIIFLGGVGEIGKHCYAVEYGDDILILGCGLLYTRLTLPGTVYTMPDITYLKSKKRQIKGCVLARAHPAHSGFASLMQREIGAPVFATEETTRFFAAAAEVGSERANRHTVVSRTDIQSIAYGKKVACGSLGFSLFRTAQNIPEATGISVSTPIGDIVFADTVPPEVDPSLFPEKPLVLMLDSIAVEKRGAEITEKDIERAICSLIENTTNKRVILPATPVQAPRFAKIVAAVSKKRMVVVEGEEMLKRLEILRKTGILETEHIYTLKEASEHKEAFETAVVILSGTMEDPYVPLVHIAEEDNAFLKINENDIILTPTNAFPGYERIVQNLYGRLSRFGAVIEMYDTDDMSAISHARQPKLTEIVKEVKPTYFIPVHGYHYMLTANANNAQKYGIGEKNIIVPNQGDVFTISEKEIKRSSEKMPVTLTAFENTPVSNEGLGQVIEDRKVLEKNGFFYIVVKVDRQTKNLKKSPDIVTRGFIYIRQSQDLIQKIRFLIKKIIENDLRGVSKDDVDTIKKTIKKETASFLRTETDKRPFVLVDVDII